MPENALPDDSEEIIDLDRALEFERHNLGPLYLKHCRGSISDEESEVFIRILLETVAGLESLVLNKELLWVRSEGFNSRPGKLYEYVSYLDALLVQQARAIDGAKKQ